MRERFFGLALSALLLRFVSAEASSQRKSRGSVTYQELISTILGLRRHSVKGCETSVISKGKTS